MEKNCVFPNEIKSFYDQFERLYPPVDLRLDTAELSEKELQQWNSPQQCGHRLLTNCVSYNMYSVVKFLVSALDASVSQRHLWDFPNCKKDVGRKNSLFAAFFSQTGVDKEMIKLLVREFGCDADCYDGYGTLLEWYVGREDDGVELDEDVIVLMVDGGADLAEALRFDLEDEEVMSELDLMVRWCEDRNFLELRNLVCRKFGKDS